MMCARHARQASQQGTRASEPQNERANEAHREVTAAAVVSAALMSDGRHSKAREPMSRRMREPKRRTER